MAVSNPLASGDAYALPLQPQNSEMDISLAGVVYHLRVKWNATSVCWIFYLEDASGTPILSGIPVVTGCDLLEQYQYLGVGGALIAQSTNNPDLVPSFLTLGTTGNVYFIVPPGTAT